MEELFPIQIPIIALVIDTRICIDAGFAVFVQEGNEALSFGKVFFEPIENRGNA